MYRRGKARPKMTIGTSTPICTNEVAERASYAGGFVRRNTTIIVIAPNIPMRLTTTVRQSSRLGQLL